MTRIFVGVAALHPVFIGIVIVMNRGVRCIMPLQRQVSGEYAKSGGLGEAGVLPSPSPCPSPLGTGKPGGRRSRGAAMNHGRLALVRLGGSLALPSPQFQTEDSSSSLAFEAGFQVVWRRAIQSMHLTFMDIPIGKRRYIHAYSSRSD